MASSCAKGAFCIVNLLYTVMALITAAGGVFFYLAVKDITDLRNYEQYQLDTTIHWPQLLPYIFVAIGGLVLLVMCCGCCGVGFGNKQILITYNVFITIVILVCAAAAAITIVVAKHKSEEFTNSTIRDVFRQAQLRPEVAAKFAELEQTLHCCGADGVKNYLTGDIPTSCCDSKKDITCNLIMNQRKGCIEVANYYIGWIFVIGAAAAGITAFLCIVSLILAISILRGMRSKIIA